MRVINKIAKVELSQFFYSPIAWLVLIVFTAQASIAFVDIYQNELMDAEAGRGAEETGRRPIEAGDRHVPGHGYAVQPQV